VTLSGGIHLFFLIHLRRSSQLQIQGLTPPSFVLRHHLGKDST